MSSAASETPTSTLQYVSGRRVFLRLRSRGPWQLRVANDRSPRRLFALSPQQPARRTFRHNAPQAKIFLARSPGSGGAPLNVMETAMQIAPEILFIHSMSGRYLTLAAQLELCPRRTPPHGGLQQNQGHSRALGQALRGLGMRSSSFGPTTSPRLSPQEPEAPGHGHVNGGSAASVSMAYVRHYGLTLGKNLPDSAASAPSTPRRRTQKHHDGHVELCMYPWRRRTKSYRNNQGLCTESHCRGGGAGLPVRLLQPVPRPRALKRSQLKNAEYGSDPEFPLLLLSKRGRPGQGVAARRR